VVRRATGESETLGSFFFNTYQNPTGRVWYVFGSHVTWYTESYRNLTLVAFGRSLVYQVT